MTAYITTRDIIIPAGSLLTFAADQRGGAEYAECVVANGPDFTSYYVVQVRPDALASGDFAEVTA